MVKVIKVDFSLANVCNGCLVPTYIEAQQDLAETTSVPFCVSACFPLATGFKLVYAATPT